MMIRLVDKDDTSRLVEIAIFVVAGLLLIAIALCA
jgi:hypothetical protein